MKSGFYISHDDWMKIQHYARARHSQVVDKRELGHEIGGMMIAKLDKQNDWILSEPTIIKQITTRSTCTMDKESLADFYIEMAQKHGKDIQFVWWHSHGNMEAFWSSTDKATMKEYASGLWSMFLVVNIMQESKFRVQMWDPIAVGEDIDLNIIDGPNTDIPETVITEVMAKCSEEQSYSRSVWKKNGYNQSYDKNQLSLGDAYTARQEIKEYNRSFGVEDDEDIAVQYLIGKLDTLNGKLCAGEIKHKAYRKAIKVYNAKMESNKFDYRIKLPKSDSELLDLVLVSFAWDMIVDKDTGQPVDAYGIDYGTSYCV
ncbi:hypothetical protein CL614_07735 [archaeon]|nr:hypothetical protein [archaeon]